MHIGCIMKEGGIRWSHTHMHTHTHTHGASSVWSASLLALEIFHVILVYCTTLRFPCQSQIPPYISRVKSGINTEISNTCANMHRQRTVDSQSYQWHWFMAHASRPLPHTISPSFTYICPIWKMHPVSKICQSSLQNQHCCTHHHLCHQASLMSLS